MNKELPPPLKSYFAAKNRQDIDAMLKPFANGATVHDEGRTLTGHAAIRAWMEETTRKYGVTVEVTDVAGEGGEVRVAALVSGNFPGSPATLRYAFTLSDGEIARLKIGS